ncbi:hypothetical protein L682_10200 [Aquipseudomonas alcaligenes OT 69]|nr:hypothetical protein L682_10200 [Pseudomonas alcaligenes OT 69]
MTSILFEMLGKANARQERGDEDGKERPIRAECCFGGRALLPW